MARKQGSFQRYVALARTVYAIYKDRARRQGRDFTLSPECLIEIIGRPCHYCKAPPGNIKRRVSYPNLILFYSGLDRKDNDAGYVPGNVVACCARCNYVKGQVLSYEEMVAVGRLLRQMKNRR